MKTQTKPEAKCIDHLLVSFNHFRDVIYLNCCATDLLNLIQKTQTPSHYTVTTGNLPITMLIPVSTDLHFLDSSSRWSQEAFVF